jgi:hypothetical protein
MNPFQSEPVVSAGIVMAIVYIAVAFGAPISEEQQKTLQDNLPVILPALALFIAWVRQSVYAPDTVKEIAKENVAAGFEAATEGKAKPTPTVAPPP